MQLLSPGTNLRIIAEPYFISLYAEGRLLIIAVNLLAEMLELLGLKFHLLTQHFSTKRKIGKKTAWFNE